MYPISIPLSKTKLFFMSTVCAGLVIWGTWDYLTLHASGESNSLLYQYGGAVLAFISLLVGLNHFLKIFSSKPGLVISKEGILDNCSQLSAGLVPWRNIEEVKVGVFKVKNSKRNIVLLEVNNFSELMRRKNPLIRLLLKINDPLGKSLRIDNMRLKIGLDELHKILEEAWKRFG